jgi:hypothetical protein
MPLKKYGGGCLNSNGSSQGVSQAAQVKISCEEKVGALGLIQQNKVTR